VLATFALPLTDLLQTLMAMLDAHAADRETLTPIFSSLTLACKIYRSLNAQDFAEEFEDTMDIWMGHFLTLLTYDNPLLHSQVASSAQFRCRLFKKIPECVEIRRNFF
jgi:hypothetical protein